jgi:hypothetical protein
MLAIAGPSLAGGNTSMKSCTHTCSGSPSRLLRVLTGYFIHRDHSGTVRGDKELWKAPEATKPRVFSGRVSLIHFAVA